MEHVTNMLATDDPGHAGGLTQRRRDVLRAEKLLTEVGIDRSKRYPLPTTEDNASPSPPSYSSPTCASAGCW